MNKDNHLIYEGYRQKRYLTPKESFHKDKEFFNYVIESNDHLSSLKEFSTKKLFSSYVTTLTERINNEAPGLISESNMTDDQAFSILNEASQRVTDQEAYNGVKDIFEEIVFNDLITKADLFLEQVAGDPNELMKRQMARRPGQRDAQGRMLPGQGAAQVQNQAQRDRAAQQIKGLRSANRAATAQNQAKRDRTAQRMQGLRAANQEAAARIAELEARIKEMEAAEANMNQQQKSQSDAIQDQLTAMIKQIQTNNIAQASGNQMTGPTINIGGGVGVPQAAPQAAQAAAPQAAPRVEAPKAAAPKAASKTSAPTSKQPGILSKIGSGIKKALPALGTIGGAALGSALGGPVGTSLGGALGRGLGRFLSPKDPKAGLGKRIKDAALSGAAGGAMGLGGQIAGEYLGSSNPGAAGIDAAADYIQPDANDDGIPIGSLGGPNPDGTTFDPDTGASTSYPAGYEADTGAEDVEPYEPKVYPKGQNISEPPTGRIPKGTTPTR